MVFDVTVAVVVIIKTSIAVVTLVVVAIAGKVRGRGAKGGQRGFAQRCRSVEVYIERVCAGG